ncbi:TonB-dependent receptor [Kiloniella sp. b19]|uniref:TonB-dependent receptor n=1 Tax=Kiloniella sp. GXU_MW_B19 TaxID=3141326 RepID=UPI0031D53512
MISRFSRSLMAGVSVLSIVCMTTGSVVAQEAADQAPSSDEESGVLTLEPVIITGEKVERDLKDTASSVFAYSADDIERQVEDSQLQDIVGNSPNIIYTGESSAPIIRGVDTQGPLEGSFAFLGGTIPRTRANIDGHYLNYNETVFGSSSIWDAESVEVFLGPQTTTQGANSIAGAIIVKTKDPTFTPEMKGQVQYGSRNSRRASVAVSGPLSDEVAARVALDYRGRDTFIDYTNPAFVQGQTDQDIRDLTGRVKLLWVPDAMPELETKLTLSHMSANRPTIEAADPDFDDLDIFATGAPSWESRTTSLVSDVEYDFGDDLVLTNQFQLSRGHVERTVASGNGAAKLDTVDVSNEVRVNYGNEASEFSGFTGLYLSNLRSDEFLFQSGDNNFDDEKQSLGVFSELSWRPAERWTLTGALRYQYDRVKRDGDVIPAFGSEYNSDQSFDEILPKFTVAYDATDDVTIGGLVSRGYNPGGGTLSFDSLTAYEFDEETSTNFEIFARTSFLNDRLRVNSNIFFTQYDDYQVSVPERTVEATRIVNADEAETYGAEISADFQAMETLRLRGSLGLLHTEITGFSAEAAAIAGSDFEGNEFASAPSVTARIGADWNVVPDWTLSGEVVHVGSNNSRSNNADEYKVGSYTVANARVLYDLADNFQFFGYVDNVFDDRSPIQKRHDRSRSAGPVLGPIVANVVKPREIGVGMKVNF